MATTADDVDIASTKASRAARAASTGTPAPYSEAMMLPTTATPSAPPSSRVVSFTAEPMLLRAGGSELMIDSVAGAPASPMPTPMSVNASASRP